MKNMFFVAVASAAIISCSKDKNNDDESMTLGSIGNEFWKGKNG